MKSEQKEFEELIKLVQEAIKPIEELKLGNGYTEQWHKRWLQTAKKYQDKKDNKTT
jgi:hypothetical protein